MLYGLILAVVVIGGLAYVLIGLKRGGEANALGVDSADSIGGDMVVVRSGEEPDDGQDPSLQVSTPLLRDAVRREVAVARHMAVLYRRLGLIAAVVIAVGIVAVAIFVSRVPALVALAAPVPLLAWGAWARVDMRVKRRRFDRRLASLDKGWDEQTQLITMAADEKPAATPPASHDERSIELSVPIPGLTTLMERMPVAPATYVNRTIMPRSVRTVDLSAPPVPAVGPAFPVSADYPQDVLPFELPGNVDRALKQLADLASDEQEESAELPHAVGE